MSRYCEVICCVPCSDCALLAACDGRGNGLSDILSPRLQAPVAGIAAVPHHSHVNGGLSVVQVDPLTVNCSCY